MRLRGMAGNAEIGRRQGGLRCFFAQPRPAAPPRSPPQPLSFWLPTPPPRPPPPHTHTDDTGRGKQSKAEKKSRKAVAKLGMKPVPGVSRVTIRKSKNILFVVARPDVFKSPSSDTYVIFGEAKVEDMSALQAAQAANQFAGLSGAGVPGAGAGPAAIAVEEEAGDADDDVEEVAGDEEGGEGGVEAKDVELVMTQASVSRAKATKALKDADGDIVSAIMSLTM